jgi:hypothetical protein
MSDKHQPERAFSRSTWAKLGFEPKPGETPVSEGNRFFDGNVTRWHTWKAWKRSQVRPIRKLRDLPF